jgi:hypothetical protein
LQERYHLVDWPWRLFERRIYAFINRQNEASMRALSDWLSTHPDYPGGASAERRESPGGVRA